MSEKECKKCGKPLFTVERKILVFSGVFLFLSLYGAIELVKKLISLFY